ncbi:hypothetical protein D3C81_1606370 [compost metagenome]
MAESSKRRYTYGYPPVEIFFDDCRRRTNYIGSQEAANGPAAAQPAAQAAGGGAWRDAGGTWPAEH